MARDNPVSRRTALKLTGAAASTALVAGCSGSGGNGGGNGGHSSDGGNGGGSSAVKIEPGTEILFKASNLAWHGKSPSGIEGKKNPTISLKAGETYKIGWDEGDGQTHNFAIYDDSDSVVSGYKTEQTAEPGDGQILEIEASSEMAEYVCEPHYGAGMKGSIEIRE